MKGKPMLKPYQTFVLGLAICYAVLTANVQNANAYSYGISCPYINEVFEPHDIIVVGTRTGEHLDLTFLQCSYSRLVAVSENRSIVYYYNTNHLIYVAEPTTRE